jgi:hypothetical protein
VGRLGSPGSSSRNTPTYSPEDPAGGRTGGGCGELRDRSNGAAKLRGNQSLISINSPRSKTISLSCRPTKTVKIAGAGMCSYHRRIIGLNSLMAAQIPVGHLRPWSKINRLRGDLSIPGRPRRSRAANRKSSGLVCLSNQYPCFHNCCEACDLQRLL